jgi:hypothetical protein
MVQMLSDHPALGNGKSHGFLQLTRYHGFYQSSDPRHGFNHCVLIEIIGDFGQKSPLKVWSSDLYTPDGPRSETSEAVSQFPNVACLE